MARQQPSNVQGYCGAVAMLVAHQSLATVLLNTHILNRHAWYQYQVKLEVVTTHQIELVVQECLSVSPAVQLGRQAVIGMEASPSHIQPNFPHCNHRHAHGKVSQRSGFLQLLVLSCADLRQRLDVDLLDQ